MITARNFLEFVRENFQEDKIGLILDCVATLGREAADQLEAILGGEPVSFQNPRALRYLSQFLVEYPDYRDVKDQIDSYLLSVQEELKFKRTLKSGSYLRPGDFKPHKSKWGIYTGDGNLLGILQHKGGDSGWDVLDAVTRKSVSTSQEPIGFRQAWDMARDIFSAAPVNPDTGGAVLPTALESLRLRRMDDE